MASQGIEDTYRRYLPHLVFLIVLSSFVHLAGLSYPREVIFDETGFGKIVTGYCCTGERHFDIHPPFGSLFIAGFAKLFHYKGDFSFSKIGDHYGDVPVFGLRLFPALTGIALSAVVFILLLQLGGSPPIAFLGGLLVTLDNALLVQTRVIGVDGLLLVASMTALSFCLLGLERTGVQRALSFVGCGFFSALAVGAKFTGLGIVGLIFLILLVRFLLDPQSQIFFIDCNWVFSYFLTALPVYLLGWYLHFKLDEGPWTWRSFLYSVKVISHGNHPTS